MKKRDSHEADFKTHVAGKAMKGECTMLEFASEYGLHPTMIQQRKKAH